MRLQASLSYARKLSCFVTYGIMLLSLLGCETAYYGTMEKLGYHKRDLLVRDVTKARDAQQEAKEQFKSALDRFTKTLDIQGAPLVAPAHSMLSRRVLVRTYFVRTVTTS